MRTVLLLENVGCGGTSARTLEVALRRVSGVHRVYVNPATEAADVEHDDRTDRAHLEHIVESLGLRVVSDHPPSCACRHEAASRRRS